VANALSAADPQAQARTKPRATPLSPTSIGSSTG
jgi:hypothetical protein